MIRPEQVWVAVEPVDMRLGIDGLSLKLQQALGRSPCDGSAYAFRNRNGTRIKLLIGDGTGVCGPATVGGSPGGAPFGASCVAC